MTDSPPSLEPRTRRGFFGLAGRAGALGAAAAAGAVARPSLAGAATPSGLELGYAETVAPVSTTSTVGVPNLILQLGPQDRPIAVEYGGHLTSTAANGGVKLVLVGAGGVVIHEVACTTPGRNGVEPAFGYKRLPPLSGPILLGVMLAVIGPGQAGLVASPTSPAFLQVRSL
jgi:hypothetical protein